MVRFLAGARGFLFSYASSPTVGKTLLHMKGTHCRDMLTTVQHTLLSFRMSGYVTLLPYTSSWLAEGQQIQDILTQQFIRATYLENYIYSMHRRRSVNCESFLRPILGLFYLCLTNYGICLTYHLGVYIICFNLKSFIF